MDIEGDEYEVLEKTILKHYLALDNDYEFHRTHLILTKMGIENDMILEKFIKTLYQCTFITIMLGHLLHSITI